MPTVVHVVTTAGFAGVERYVCTVATATAARGWEVCVVGGDQERMPTTLQPHDVRWERGATPLEAVRSVVKLGRVDVCHAHMTTAEAIAVMTRPAHRAAIVSTRHFAARRGASRIGAIGAPWIAKRLTREIAIGEFVAGALERPPAAVILNGVPASPCLWRAANRVVLVMQRLEGEKDTLTALRAWKRSGLHAAGWSLRVVGSGSQRQELERRVAAESIDGVAFMGTTSDVGKQLAGAGIFLASALAEPLGLSVLEAMAAGVPVVATASGGHLETIGSVAGAALFPPADAGAGARALTALGSAATRADLSEKGRKVVADRFTVDTHVDRLLREYHVASSAPSASRLFAPLQETL